MSPEPVARRNQTVRRARSLVKAVGAVGLALCLLGTASCQDDQPAPEPDPTVFEPLSEGTCSKLNLREVTAELDLRLIPSGRYFDHDLTTNGQGSASTCAVDVADPTPRRRAEDRWGVGVGIEVEDSAVEKNIEEIWSDRPDSPGQADSEFVEPVEGWWPAAYLHLRPAPDFSPFSKGVLVFAGRDNLQVRIQVYADIVPASDLGTMRTLARALLEAAGRVAEQARSR